jgi:hypothetical protein
VHCGFGIELSRFRGACDVGASRWQLLRIVGFGTVQRGNGNLLQASGQLAEALWAPQYHVHVSGHMMSFRLKTALREIGAKQVLPVQTEQASLFAKFMDNLKKSDPHREGRREYSL